METAMTTRLTQDTAYIGIRLKLSILNRCSISSWKDTYPDKDQRAEWLLKVWSQAPLSNSESSTISTCQLIVRLPKASTYHHSSTEKELNTSTQKARFCSSDCSKIPNIHTLYNPWPNLLIVGEENWKEMNWTSEWSHEVEKQVTPCKDPGTGCCWELLTNAGLPGQWVGPIGMETASALTVVPPWQVNAAGVVVALNESLCTFINICLREKHKPAGILVSLYS